MAETADRTLRGRTSRRQRFVVASVGEVPRRFVPRRGAGPERADVGARVGDIVSGDFRREGMGAPGVGDSPAHLTASRPVPFFGRGYHANLRLFARSAAGEGYAFWVCDTRKRNQPGRGHPCLRTGQRCSSAEHFPPREEYQVPAYWATLGRRPGLNGDDCCSSSHRAIAARTGDIVVEASLAP